MYILFVTYVKYEMMRGLYGSPVNLSCVLAAAKMKKDVRFQRVGYPAGWNLIRDNKKGANLKLVNPLILKVPGRGIEPRTREFSVHFFQKTIPHHFQVVKYQALTRPMLD